MRKKLYVPSELMLPKRNRVKVREYQFTFCFRGTDSEGSDYMSRTFSYSKPVKYSRVLRDFVKWLQTVYLPCDYVAVERIEFDIVYVRQHEVLFETSCYDEGNYWPF